MDSKRPSVLPLVLMIIWYALLLVGTGGFFLIGLMFGSEAYRGQPMPLIDWIRISGPILVNLALLGLTIMFWNKDLRPISFTITGLSVVAVLGAVLFGGGVVV